MNVEECKTVRAVFNGWALIGYNFRGQHHAKWGGGSREKVGMS